MGYLMNSDSYECDFCGHIQKWDDTDEVHGDMWGCEKCGKTFCSKCLKDVLGDEGYMIHMQQSELLLCPDCAKKVIESI